MYLSRACSVTVAAACLLAISSAANAAAPGAGPAHRHHDGPTRIVICKHGLDTFDVYADGQSIRQASLSQGKKSCTDWDPVEPGVYDIAFAQRVASQPQTQILAILKVDGKEFRKLYRGQGVLDVLARKGQIVRLDLETHRSHY